MTAALLLGVLSLVATYAAAGAIGGAIPVNGRWSAPERGVRIYVESNGVHTGIVVPVQAAGVDWSDLVRPSDLRDRRYAGYPYRSFGWGERTFYLETPTWADVRPGTVLAAAFGSERTLMHVDQVPAPRPGADVRTILLRPEEYRRLADFIRAGFAPGGARLAGYGANDAFYEARGRYSGLMTCNAWTGAALRHAGVRMGAWTPFPATVLWWLP